MDSSYQRGRFLPGANRPRGAEFFFGTWSGRLLVVNTIVFLVVTVVSGSLFLPSEEALMAFGIKEPVALANGEYWRLITPVFLHIGIIHFGMNSLMLYIIGYQLESLLGRNWFLAIYLSAGLAGNVASGVFSVLPSAGASGAIFGLLGCGFFLERSIGRIVLQRTGSRPKQGVYTITVLLNVGLGLLIPMIDNAAHLGGLVAGVVLTNAMLRLRPNRLQKVHKAQGYAAIGALALVVAVGIGVATNQSYVVERLERAGDDADNYYLALKHFDGAIKLRPEDAGLRCKRGRIQLLFGESLAARVGGFQDLRACHSLGDLPQVHEIERELRLAGRADLADELQKMVDNGTGF